MTDNLEEIYGLFVQGVPVGGLLAALVWAVGYAVDFLSKLFKSA